MPRRSTQRNTQNYSAYSTGYCKQQLHLRLFTFDKLFVQMLCYWIIRDIRLHRTIRYPSALFSFMYHCTQEFHVEQSLGNERAYILSTFEAGLEWS